jgi:hypothetical protein
MVHARPYLSHVIYRRAVVYFDMWFLVEVWEVLVNCCIQRCLRWRGGRDEEVGMGVFGMDLKFDNVGRAEIERPALCDRGVGMRRSWVGSCRAI